MPVGKQLYACGSRRNFGLHRIESPAAELLAQEGHVPRLPTDDPDRMLGIFEKLPLAIAPNFNPIGRRTVSNLAKEMRRSGEIPRQP